MVGQRGDCADAYPYEQARMTHKAMVLKLLGDGGARMIDIVPSCVASIIDNAGAIFQEADEVLPLADKPHSFDVLKLAGMRDKAITILAMVSLAYETANCLQYEEAPAGLEDMPVTEVLAALTGRG